MTLRSGLAAQIGFGDETTWGTAVTPTVFVPLVSEDLAQEIARLESAGIIAGQRVLRSQQWGEGDVTCGGSIGLELFDRDTGMLLKHMFGGSSMADGAFSPADLTGNGLTVQVGRPDTNNGTVRPYTYAGGKVASWEVGLVSGEIVTLGLDLVARHEISHRTVADGVTTNSSPNITSATAAFIQNDVGKPISGTNIPAGTTIASVTSSTAAVMSANATGTGSGLSFVIGLALTSASYTSGIAPYRFLGGSVTLAGSAFKVHEATLAGDNGLDVDRRFVGQQTIEQPLEADLRSYTGSLDSEFWDEVAYRRFLAGTEAALVIAVASGTRSLTFTTNVRFDGDTPKVDGRGLVGQMLPFVCVGASTDAGAITATLDTT